MSDRHIEIAHHEAAHCVVAHLYREVQAVSIVVPDARGKLGGLTRLAPREERAGFCETLQDITILVAGVVGEKLAYATDGSSYYAADPEVELGPTPDRLMAEGLAAGVTGSGDERAALLALATATATRLVHQHRFTIKVIAEALLKDGYLAYQQIRRLLIEGEVTCS